MSIRVNLGPRSYDIAIVSDDRAGVGAFARERAAKSSLAVLIGDSHVETHGNAIESRLMAAGFATARATIPAGEASKCLASAERLYEQLSACHADRRTLIVAVGGGVVGDLAGFVAAT